MGNDPIVDLLSLPDELQVREYFNMSDRAKANPEKAVNVSVSMSRTAIFMKNFPDYQFFYLAA